MTRELAVRLLNDPDECVVINLDDLPEHYEHVSGALQAEYAPLSTWVEVCEGYLRKGDWRAFEAMMDMLCGPGTCARARGAYICVSFHGIIAEALMRCDETSWMFGSIVEIGRARALRRTTTVSSRARSRVHACDDALVVLAHARQASHEETDRATIPCPLN